MRKPFEPLQSKFYEVQMGIGFNYIDAKDVDDAVSQDKYEYLSRIAKYQKQCEEQLALYEARINNLTEENKQLKERLVKAAATYLSQGI